MSVSSYVFSFLFHGKSFAHDAFDSHVARSSTHLWYELINTEYYTTLSLLVLLSEHRFLEIKKRRLKLRKPGT